MKKIKMGMVGGGQGAFIGAVHRIAAQIDSQIELVCGAFSRDPDNAARTASELDLPFSRSYASYEEMFEAEQALPSDERMEFVAIVTPNYLHLPIALAALENGFHVLCEKPATLTLEEAVQLSNAVKESGLQFGLTHTYTGYPMVKEAKHRVTSGELGNIRRVVVEYPQGWLADTSAEGGKQAAWRIDPQQAGVSGCFADIGVHAANLAEYITGLDITDICADLNATLSGRTLDDDGAVLTRFSNGARGILWASQVCIGEENNLRIRVYGEKASLEWAQQEPNTLWLSKPDQPKQMLRAGGPYLSEIAQTFSRTPAGHPEGYLEAFANIYTQFAQLIREGEDYVYASDIPGVTEALRGMSFIESVVLASKQNEKWYALPQY